MTATTRQLPRIIVIGTRAVVVWLNGFAVICATCDKGKSLHTTKEAAINAATRASATPCRACGAS